ncbi:MAG: hypothetical protein LBV59_05865 [Sphingobacterium sp.]|jgi:hypothetical protein|uniref:hypothetical protein n=1 Tax=Sphingobacterium sp. TaxID=341027 RepID=UPI00284E3A42|nr:hypothetical protein [Sphingobacterium sp.]MDR3007440.1 hypothetical protein [Sphingobacterium sp.]
MKPTVILFLLLPIFGMSLTNAQSLSLHDIEKAHWSSINSYFQKPQEIQTILDTMLSKGYLLVLSIKDPQPAFSGYAEFSLRNISNPSIKEKVVIYTSDVTTSGKHKLTCGFTVETQDFQQYLAWRTALVNNHDYFLIKQSPEQIQYHYKANKDIVTLGPIYGPDTSLPSKKKQCLAISRSCWRWKRRKL